MKVLFVGGPWDGRVADVSACPFHLHVATCKDEHGETRQDLWDDKLFFKYDKVLKECYVQNEMFTDQFIYVHQPLTVRHAAAAMMAAYHWALSNGWSPGMDPDKQIAGPNAGAIETNREF